MGTGSKVSGEATDQIADNVAYETDKEINDQNHLIILTNAATSLQGNQSNEQIKEEATISHQQRLEDNTVSDL